MVDGVAEVPGNMGAKNPASDFFEGVDSRILAEVFVGLLQADKESFVNQQPAWKPTLPAAQPATFTMPDLLRLINDLDPINEPSTSISRALPSMTNSHGKNSPLGKRRRMQLCA